jgi:hypothetical protein
MTFEKSKGKSVKSSGKGIIHPCRKDKTLRITGGKQFAGARILHKGKEGETLNEMSKDIRRKQETMYDGSEYLTC